MISWHSGWRFVAAACVIAMSACGDDGDVCGPGFRKDGKWCRRIDAGASEGGLEADGGGSDAGSDAATGEGGSTVPTSDAASTDASSGDATVSSDAASMMQDSATSDASPGNSDASATLDTGVVVDAGAQDAGSDAVTSCSAGFVLKSGKCEDIDECFEGTHQCHMTSTCKNTAGAYDCTCPLGYSGGTSAGFACAPRIAVGIGSRYGCALLLDGTVRCWGDNTSGQLGDGSQTARAVPVAVSGLSDVVLLDSGEGSMCAVLRDGSVRCWGSNDSGQLGDGTMMNRLVPVVSQVSGVRSIDIGNRHGCAALANGTARCWGENGEGQLGTGTTSTTSMPTPVAVAGVSDTALVFVNQKQTCVVSRTGVARCWGQGFFNGPQQSSVTPVAVNVPHNVVSMAIGGFHSCSLHGDGFARCWGTPGMTTNPQGSGSPSDVVVTLRTVTITISLYDTFILGADGTTRYWGQEAGTASPVVFASFGPAAVIATGILYNCALLKDGTVSCVGANGVAPIGGLDLW